MVFVVAEDAGFYFFSWEGEGDEDDPITGGIFWGVFSFFECDSCDAGSEVGEGVDGEFEFLVVFEGEGSEFFVWAHLVSF